MGNWLHVYHLPRNPFPYQFNSNIAFSMAFLKILIGNYNKTELHVKHPRGNHNCAKFENVFTQ